MRTFYGHNLDFFWDGDNLKMVCSSGSAGTQIVSNYWNITGISKGAKNPFVNLWISKWSFERSLFHQNFVHQSLSFQSNKYIFGSGVSGDLSSWNDFQTMMPLTQKIARKPSLVKQISLTEESMTSPPPLSSPNQFNRAASHDPPGHEAKSWNS